MMENKEIKEKEEKKIYTGSEIFWIGVLQASLLTIWAIFICSVIIVGVSEFIQNRHRKQTETFVVEYTITDDRSNKTTYNFTANSLKDVNKIYDTIKDTRKIEYENLKKLQKDNTIFRVIEGE